MDSKDILKVKNLRTYFYQSGRITRAVDDITFDLVSGGRLGIAGQSGSGKTQTLMSIAGLVGGRPGIVSGSIIFRDGDLLSGIEKHVRLTSSDGTLRIMKDERRWRRRLEANYADIRGRRIGMIFQEPKSALVPYQTVERQMAEAADAVSNGGSAYDRDRAEWLLTRMGFKDPARILGSYPHEISGGESQRVTIGIVLQSDPDLLLADEPTSSLDAASSAEVLELLDNAAQRDKTALILVSHNASQLSQLVDRVVVMYAGTIFETGSTGSVLSSVEGAAHPYTKQLVAAGAARSGGTIHVTEDDKGKPTSGCPYRFNCALKGKLTAEAQNLCENERPNLIQIEDGHFAACWGLNKN